MTEVGLLFGAVFTIDVILLMVQSWTALPAACLLGPFVSRERQED